MDNQMNFARTLSNGELEEALKELKEDNSPAGRETYASLRYEETRRALSKVTGKYDYNGSD